MKDASGRAEELLARLWLREEQQAETGAALEFSDVLGRRIRAGDLSDQRVSTWVGAHGCTLPFQEFMILERAEGPIESVELRGLDRARPSDVVLQAIAEADAIVIGPSNPVISIGPILALPGMREARRAAAAPVVAVSPFVAGRSVKGPTEAFCEQAGIEPSAAGIALAYADVLDGIVSDETLDGGRGDAPKAHVTDTLMDSAEDRARLARELLDFAGSLGQ